MESTSSAQINGGGSQPELLLLDAAVALVVPFITDLLNQYVPNQKVRFGVAMVMSFVIALATNLFTGRFSTSTPEEIMASLGTVFVVSQSVYRLYWKESGIRQTMIK